MTATRTMTREQLLHLVDRARRGVALPAEHDALAAGINAMANRLEDWKQAAGAGMTLTDNLRAERDALAAGVPLICSDERHKAKVFALEIRAAKAEADLAEARMLARHGYEIGQRSCTWADHGVAPAWLTEHQPTTEASQ